MAIQVDYYWRGKALPNENIEMTISKASLQSKINRLLTRGATVEHRPRARIKEDMEVTKVEVWRSADRRKKLVLILEDGSRLIIQEPIRRERVV